MSTASLIHITFYPGECLMPNSEKTKHILIAALGISPQILTETLYALLHRPTPWVPDEIYVFTTHAGKEKIEAQLLHAETGQFFEFYRQYLQGKYPLPEFNTNHICLFRSKNGCIIHRLMTEDDNEDAVNTMLALIREKSQDEQTQLHLSIAGGRKTTSFYAGYLFSLFARPQDEISHVLVSPENFECSDFYFPPKPPRNVIGRDGLPIHSDNAQITLIDIPFVPLRHFLSEKCLHHITHFKKAIQEIKASLTAPSIEVHLNKHTLICQKTRIHHHLLDKNKKDYRQLSLEYFSFYAWLCMQTKLHTEGRFIINSRDIGQINKCKLFFNQKIRNLDSKTMTDLKNTPVLDDRYFPELVSKIKRCLTVSLTPALAEYYLIKSEKNRETTGTNYYLSLTPEQINFNIPLEDFYAKGTHRIKY